MATISSFFFSKEEEEAPQVSMFLINHFNQQEAKIRTHNHKM
ncbi:unnamed protein product [Arabidopsis lyrata]|nr:unnamed protein product [Arabidopsis lyrata]